MPTQMDQFYGDFSGVEHVVWDTHRFTLLKSAEFDNPFAIAGSDDFTFPKPFKMLYINIIERPCVLSVGKGNTFSIGKVFPGQKQLLYFATEQDTINVSWTTDPAYSASGVFTNGTNLKPIADIWVSSQDFFYYEFQDDGKPAVLLKDQTLLPRNDTDYAIPNGLPDMSRPVLAFPALATDGIAIGADYVPWVGSDYVSPRLQRIGSVMPYSLPENFGTVGRRGNLRTFLDSYAIMFTRTLASEPYLIGKTLTAATPAPLATIWHPSSSTRYAKLRRIDVALADTSAAANITVWLAGINTQPTGGSSMLKSPQKNSISASTLEARSAPSGGAADTGDRYGLTFYASGITGAAPTTNPAQGIRWENLYDDTVNDGLEPLTVEPSEAFGWQVLVDSDANTTIHGLVRAWVTEY